ncbi:alkaline phosphatase family protein [Haloferula sp. BvORR071]|uniref:alkaline phosphatase family protein n=1 Tax=Haloferula sp. BvORR071 TaxID=1396141 RepID=UPI00054FE9AB|nr:alkaline phosphatase family protein [Haloferula sp. BvORR071]
MSIRKPAFLLLPLFGTGLLYAGPGTANPFAGKRALVIGIDGLRADALKQQVESGNAPAIASLVANGTVTWNAYAGGKLGGVTQQPTISGPGWTSILTGMWTDRHNVVDNGTPAYNQPGVSGSYLVDQAPHFAKRLEEAAPGTFASSIASWNWIEDYLVTAQPSYLDYHQKGSGSSYALRDQDVKSKAVAHLAAADPDVLFLHFDQVDGAGHSSGFSTSVPSYMSAITAVDVHVGDVLAAIAARPQRAAEQWVVVLTTDHGGTTGGSHGGQSIDERTIPFIVSGNGIPAGVSTASPGQAAVPATVMRYFGLSIPATWTLAEDGFVTGPLFAGNLNAGAVDLTWSLPAAGIPGLSVLQVLRNGNSIATLPTSQTNFTDPSPVAGLNNYELVLTGTSEASLKTAVTLPNPGERVWDDANGNNSWNTADANWLGGEIFGNGNDARFVGTTGESVSVVAGGVLPANTVVNSGSYTFSGGSISGTLTKNGGGSLTLSSANGFTDTAITAGPNSQTAGALQIGNYSALGSGPVTFSHAVSSTAFYFLPAAGSGTLPNSITLPAGGVTTRFLTDETNVTATLGGVISGGSANNEILIDNDSGTNDVGKIRLSNAANSFTASRLRINRGGLVVTSDAALGNPANDLTLDVTSNLAGSGLILEGTMSLGSGRSLTVASQCVLDTQATADIVAGPLVLTGQLVKRGSAALRLDAAGSGNAGVSLTEGSITLGNAAALGTGTLSVATTASAGFLNTTPLTGTASLGNAIVLPADTTATNRTVLMNGGVGQQLSLGGVISGGGSNTTLYLNTSLVGDNAATFVLNGANTFTGKTQLNRGSLSINSNASLGAAANALVIDANVGSKLIFASGMSFTHPVALSTTTVFDNADPVSISAVLSGSATLSKSGNGSLTLSAANTHTGTLAVNSGSVVVDGSLAASGNAVSVAAGATLGGIGTISRPVNVSGNIAPAAGAIGKLSIPAALTMAQGSSYAVGLGSWNGAAGIAYDSLDVSSLAITATEAAKFTVNVDASALTGFDNTPKSFVIASATAPVTGLASNNHAVVVSGGSFSGVWSLQASGNNLLLVYSTGAPGFAGWALAQSLPENEAGFEGDADHDGIANGLEFVLGTDPLSASAAPAVSCDEDYLIFTYSLADGAAYLQPVVEHNATLAGTWTTAVSGQAGVIVSSVPAGEGRQSVTVKIPRSAAPALYVRLRAAEGQ